MATNHYIYPTVPEEDAMTVRLGAGNSSTQNFASETEVGKSVNLVGESRYDLTAAGDEIEGFVYAVELATQNGYSIGSVIDEGAVTVMFDGLQATGAGTIAIGSYVVAGTQTALGTSQTYPKVRKATAAVTALTYKWRVVSLGTAGTGAVGTTGVIKRIG